MMRSRAARRRRALAKGYEQVLDDAFGPPIAFCARVPVRRDQVLLALPEIDHVIARLRDDEHPPPDVAVQQAHLLLCDGASPMFSGGTPTTLRRRLRVVCEAME